MNSTALKNLFGQIDFGSRLSAQDDDGGASDRMDRRCMLGLFLLCLTVYGLTLAPGVVPGESAVATAQALRLLPEAPVTQPLWLAVARAVAAVPLLDKVVSLNLFSAVCASLAAALLFRLTKRLIVELLREPPAIRMVPLGEEGVPEAESAGPGDEVDPSRLQSERLIATMGGIVTALAFAFSAPFWIASVSLHPQTFHVLLALVTLERLFSYYFTGQNTTCLAALFLMGLGCVDSALFLALVPVALFVIVRASIRFEQINDSFILLSLIAVFSGVALSLVLLVATLMAGQSFDADRMTLHAAAALAAAHARSIGEGLPKGNWIFILFQTVVPALMVALSIKRYNAPTDETARWKWGLSNIIFTGLALACVMNVPKTAWCLAREGSHLPILPVLMIAIALGGSLSYWLLAAKVPSYDWDYELIPPSFFLRSLGYGGCLLICVALLRMFGATIDTANGRSSAFATVVADEMLQQARPAQTLVTDGTLDLNLLIQAAAQGCALDFIPAAGSSLEDAPDQPPKLNPFSLASLHKRDAALVIRNGAAKTRLASGPESPVKRAATASCPQELSQTGLTPLPAGLLYLGLPAGENCDCDALVLSQQSLWAKLGPLLADNPSLRPDLRRLQTRLRRQTSRLANDFGVFLEARGRGQDADSAYAAALKSDAGNISASLNRYGLAAHRADAPRDPEELAHILALAERPGLNGRLERELSRCGTLAPRDTDTLLPAVLTDFDNGKPGAENVHPFCERWMSALSAQAASGAASPASPLAQALALSSSPKLMQAVTLLLDGRTENAETNLRYLVRNQPKLLSAWALLAELLMNRGDLEEVARSILPAMRVAAKIGNADDRLINLTQGSLHLRSSPPDFAGARECFSRVVVQKPDLEVACEELLRAGILLGKTELLEADALTILRLSPGHATANAILGSLRLRQQRYEDAERCLRESLASKPTAGACNDLAELYRRSGRLDEAEHQARLAIRLKPTLYQAWDTLGNILLQKGRTDEANQALRCALIWGHSDPRLYLTLTRLRIKQNRLSEAAQVLDFARPLAVNVTNSVQAEYEQLLQDLTKLTASAT